MSDINISDMEVLRLHDLFIASKYTIDQGNPSAYAKLASQGLAEKKGPGYVITELGRATLSINKHRLFGRKARVKKCRKTEEYETEE